MKNTGLSTSVVAPSDGGGKSSQSLFATLTTKQIYLIVGAVLVVGTVAGMAAAVSGGAEVVIDPGGVNPFTFCEQKYSYPTFSNERSSTEWSFYR